MSLSFDERKAVVDVKSGIVDIKDGKLYHHLFTMRLTGDYDDTYGLTSEDVLPLIEPASELIEKVIVIAINKINESQA